MTGRCCIYQWHDGNAQGRDPCASGRRSALADARWVFNLQPGEVYWCTADPGWVTGVSYGIIAPLTHGATMIVDEADFDARRWYAILEQERVKHAGTPLPPQFGC